jgi:hypothetical protein
MTVKELREALESVPDDYRVFLTDMNNKVKIPHCAENVNIKESFKKVFIESEDAIKNFNKKMFKGVNND